jgi:hypothetical protein
MPRHGEYIPERTLNAGCGRCKSTENLSRCASCKVMRYCSREHQIADRENHKAACKRVKKAYERVDHEERTLRALPPSLMLPANVFEESIGHFWGILDTRDYMRSRLSLVEAFEGVPTKSAVEARLDHVKDMLRLCRGDNIGVRYFAPFMMIRLGQDQEAYDFMKWHAWVSHQDDYDWGNMDEPFLNFKDEDVFEDVDLFCGQFPSLQWLIALAILKFKLFRDLKMLHDSAAIGDRVPIEVFQQIQGNLPSSPLIANNQKIITDPVYAYQLGRKMFSQLEKLIHHIHRANPHYFNYLLDPTEVLAHRPGFMSRGSYEEACLVMQMSYDTWAETPGSIRTTVQLFIENELADDDD